MPEVVEEVAEKVRVVELKKTQKPPVGEYYYGDAVEFGLREVKRRRSRTAGGGKEKFQDFLMWYEKPTQIDNDIQPLIYYVMPPPPDLFPDCYYPVAQWNISQPHLDDQDNIPDWQRRVVLDENGSPVYVGGSPLFAFHYIVVNRRFIPEQRVDGSEIDGLFVPHVPVSGEVIMEREKAKLTLGGDLLGMTRRRVGDSAVTVQ